MESTTVVFSRSPYDYPVDEVVWGNAERGVVRELKRWRLLVRALRDFDVVHFNFGTTIAPERIALDVPGADAAGFAYRTYARLLEQLDLPLLRRAGKAIFVTFQGSDARQGDVATGGGAERLADEAREFYTPESDENKRRRIRRLERYADGIYALNPDLLGYLPPRARFVPYAHVDPRMWEPPATPAGSRRRPLVVHAPTKRALKGTRFLLDAVARLQAEGLEFDLRLVEGVTREEAKTVYRSADLVVDQLLIGWYGGVAVEAMALERPVIAYLRDDDLSVLQPEMRAEIPVIPAQPATIHDVLKELLTTRRGELAEIGRRGRDYVGRWHDPLRIAQGHVADYEAAIARHRR